MKKVIAFFDGQNLYHNAREIWDYFWPNYDPLLLARNICNIEKDRKLIEVRFYTGIPTIKQNPFWHKFWTNKIRKLLNDKIFVFKGNINIHGKEKGVDVRIAIDIIKLTFEKGFDVAIIFSQDRDLIEAIKMAKTIASSQKRKVEFECAYLYDDNSKDKRGLGKTKWRQITQDIYDKCLDLKDYR